ncbi:hypothetical protein [Sulfuriferula multivorans]|uniref:hypothetical protein n=1 Tax=Sulfuriferula multivorans TaxID=1559896 RepID=UPI000F5C029F|nr:hypothetical protein [Sulfuriferula multivorans]
MNNFDYETPYLTVIGLGKIDCRAEENFQSLIQMYAHTGSAVNEGRDAAQHNFNNGGQPKNPYGQWLRPLKWTAWNLGYSFWIKNLHFRNELH